MIDLIPQFCSYDFFGTTVNGRDIFGTTDDIQGIVSRHVKTCVLLSHKKLDGHIHVKVELGEGERKVPIDEIVKRAEKYKPKE